MLFTIMWGITTELLVSVLKNRPGIRSRMNTKSTLTQIEGTCPLQDVTCADDTNKVVRVIFSVDTAQVCQIFKKYTFCS